MMEAMAFHALGNRPDDLRPESGLGSCSVTQLKPHLVAVLSFRNPAEIMPVHVPSEQRHQWDQTPDLIAAT